MYFHEWLVLHCSVIYRKIICNNIHSYQFPTLQSLLRALHSGSCSDPPTKATCQHYFQWPPPHWLQPSVLSSPSVDLRVAPVTAIRFFSVVNTLPWTLSFISSLFLLVYFCEPLTSNFLESSQFSLDPLLSPIHTAFLHSARLILIPSICQQSPRLHH